MEDPSKALHSGSNHLHSIKTAAALCQQVLFLHFKRQVHALLCFFQTARHTNGAFSKLVVFIYSI